MKHISYPDVVRLREENLGRYEDGRSEEILAIVQGHPAHIEEASTITDCVRRGYAPPGYALADFTIIRTGGRFHLFHIPRVPGNISIHPSNEHWFGHATSHDLDTWVTGHPPLATEPANYFESAHIWAPFVMEHQGVFHMFYTGLSGEPSQVLCLATSTDPDLNVWHRHVGNPILPLEGFSWHRKNERGHLRQGRDPHVTRVGDHFLMAYTTMHADGCPAVGGLVSHDLKQWQDIGPILYRPMRAGGWMPESVLVQQLTCDRWVLIPSVGPGLEYYISDNPHSWHDAECLPIEYSDTGSGEEAIGPEVLCRNDEKGEWLVAFFQKGDNRLYLGILDVRGAWRLERIQSPSRLAPWLALIEEEVDGLHPTDQQGVRNNPPLTH